MEHDKYMIQTPFPMELKFNKKQTTEWFDSSNDIKVTMVAFPTHDFRRVCYDMIKSTWADTPQTNPSAEQINETFMKLLRYKVLPNSMEHIIFQFRIEGLTLIEVTHVLRHRQLHSIHAQCTADRFLQEDSAFIPSSIKGTAFEDRYKKLTEDAKTLYADMIDGGISLLDARYILTRNHRYFYYVGMNLMTFFQFIKQRRCTAIQPELDNIIAQQIYDQVTSIIPEIKQVLTLDCDKSCASVVGDLEDTTRVYQPDEVHAKLIGKYNAENFIYPKTRREMGLIYEQPGTAKLRDSQV